MVFMKGQGATEYLVLLAVVLIIALVSIALLAFFPGIVPDTKITQSAIYWRGQARPFAITEHVITAAGATSVVLLNTEAGGTMTLINITVGNASTAAALNTAFAPGESKTITTTVGANPGTAGNIYDLSVVMFYNSSNGIVGRQTGQKTLTGKYS